MSEVKYYRNYESFTGKNDFELGHNTQRIAFYKQWVQIGDSYDLDKHLGMADLFANEMLIPESMLNDVFKHVCDVILDLNQRGLDTKRIDELYQASGTFIKSINTEPITQDELDDVFIVE